MELYIRDVFKTYSNGVKAIKDVTLTIPTGMYGLLGPNVVGCSGARQVSDKIGLIPICHIRAASFHRA